MIKHIQTKKSKPFKFNHEDKPLTLKEFNSAVSSLKTDLTKEISSLKTDLSNEMRSGFTCE